MDQVLIREQLLKYGLDLTHHQIGQVDIYIDKLLFWNQRVNLTSIRDPVEIIGRHFAESMVGASKIQMTGGTLLDIGSGAGFPGLAIKLVCPRIRAFLLEPITKKAVFLSEVVRAIGLDRTEILSKRIEDLQGATFDVATMRAVGDFPAMLSHARRCLKVGGQVLLWVGTGDVKAISEIDGWVWSDPTAIPFAAGTAILEGRNT